MTLDYKQELKIWLFYFGTLFLSIYVHEIGHCIPAWISGYTAIPTPAKEYINGTIPDGLRQNIALGGIFCSVLFSVIILIAYFLKSFNFSSTLLAGAIAMPGLYTLRFILAGRGHDATEFQDAQSVLGLSYFGHSLDWIFLILFLAGLIIWVIKSKPRFKVIWTLIIGFVLTFIFVICLQSFNNLIFDPIFQSQ